MAPLFDGDPEWVPDARTVEWYVGVAHEDRIWATLRSEALRRGAGLDPESEEYWRLVAEIAVEHLSFDMVEQARARGAQLPLPPPAEPPPAN
jgi:hypothetical protein